jgi:phosphomannomutase
MLAIIALAIQHETPVSRLTKLLPARFTASDRIPEIPTAWSQELLAKLNAGDVHFSSLVEGEQSGIQTVDQTDGYRVTFTSGNVVHLRPSGNAPELRCYAESDNESTAEALCAGTLNCVAELYKSSI